MRPILLSVILFKLSLCIHDNRPKIEDKNLWSNVNNVEDLRAKDFWIKDAQRMLKEKLQLRANKKVAKNVIFFIGDGMSIPTTTASRIYEGQAKGIVGERNVLSFEKFPHIALSKTYCADTQVSDSACTATAYHSGVKANLATIGVTAAVPLNNCSAANLSENQLHSIAAWAQSAGKGTGIVTNTRVTHASPAGAYAHTANRDFESDLDVVSREKDPGQCRDIARQLIENPTSSLFNVILGGGATKFLPNNTEFADGTAGERADGRNLIREWAENKLGNAISVQNRHQLLNINTANTDYLLGLFSSSHMAYHLDANQTSEPSLAEMTEVAIRVLQKQKDGYFLFVEGGRIDHAHHDTLAVKALDETVQFSSAVQRALELTNSDDTLIVVSADHGHTMTISGYPVIGNPITGIGTDLSDVDQLPYSTLSYANGPAFEDFLTVTENGSIGRVDLRSLSNFGDKDFKYPATVPLTYETHGGSDVAIYANGPWSHLFTGLLEQSTLPAFMGYAACIGPGLHACQRQYHPLHNLFPKLPYQKVY